MANMQTKDICYTCLRKEHWSCCDSHGSPPVCPDLCQPEPQSPYCADSSERIHVVLASITGKETSFSEWVSPSFSLSSPSPSSLPPALPFRPITAKCGWMGWPEPQVSSQRTSTERNWRCQPHGLRGSPQAMPALTFSYHRHWRTKITDKHSSGLSADYPSDGLHESIKEHWLTWTLSPSWNDSAWWQLEPGILHLTSLKLKGSQGGRGRREKMRGRERRDDHCYL